MSADADTLAVVLERARSDGPDGEPFRRLVDDAATPPAWIDWASLARGQEVFVRYAGAAELSLLHLSLIGGFGAPKINKVLMATGYLANRNTNRRLFETNQMIVDCLPPGSMEPLVGGGWLSCMRVRFLHARVRERLLRTDRWDRAAWGVPINQEDMVATLLSFHYNVLFAIQRIGVPLSERELSDYSHLWRYIGHVMGIRDEHNPCDSFPRSKAMLESLVMHIVEPDATSEYLSHHVIRSLELKKPSQWSFEAHAQMARMFMGDELADRLKLPASRYYYVLHSVTFAVLRVLAFVSHAPGLSRHVLAINLHGLQEMTSLGLDHRPPSYALTHAPSDDNLVRNEDAARRKGQGQLDPKHGLDPHATDAAAWTNSRSLVVRVLSLLGSPALWAPATGAVIVGANALLLFALVYRLGALRRLLQRAWSGRQRAARA